LGKEPALEDRTGEEQWKSSLENGLREKNDKIIFALEQHS